MLLGLAAYAVSSLLLEIVEFKVAVPFLVVRIFKPLIILFFKDLGYTHDILVEFFAILPLIWPFLK